MFRLLLHNAVIIWPQFRQNTNEKHQCILTASGSEGFGDLRVGDPPRDDEWENCMTAMTANSSS